MHLVDFIQENANKLCNVNVAEYVNRCPTIFSVLWVLGNIKTTDLHYYEARQPEAYRLFY